MTAEAPATERPLPEDMLDFLRELGLVRGDAPPPPSRPLTGGVSSDIWLIAFPLRPICIKRALPALKVKADWRVPVERSRYEFAWLQRAAAILPDAVPPLIGQSRDGRMFATAYLDPKDAPLWKAQLLRGHIDPQFAAAVGDALGRIHARTAGDAATARQFATDSLFHALRLEPYLLATAEKHPELAPSLKTLAETTAKHRLALVHGDVSPKNILIGARGPTFLDAECAWYGDPAFDLSFCLNHLLLKRLPLPHLAAPLRAAFEALKNAHLRHVRWEPRAGFERRCAALLPGLFLARIDGKSPVEYVTDEADREAVRRYARATLTRAPKRLSEIADGWFGTSSHAQRQLDHG